MINRVIILFFLQVVFSQYYQVFEGSVSSFGSTGENSSYLGGQSIQSNTLESSSYTLSSGYYHFNPTFDDVIHVDDDAIESIGDGSIFRPFKHIQQGVDAAKEGQLVLVEPGFYPSNNYISKNIELCSRFILNNDSTYINNTILYYSNINMPNNNSNFKFEGFTMRGLMSLYLSNQTVDQITFQNLNFSGPLSTLAIFGEGAMRINNIKLDSLFTGITTFNNVNLHIDNSKFSNLTGCAVLAVDSNVEIYNSVINNANAGILGNNSYMSFNNGIIINSQAPLKIFNNGDLSIVDSKIINNSAWSDSTTNNSGNAVIYSQENSNLTIINSIITGSQYSPEPIFEEEFMLIDSDSKITLVNSIVRDNEINTITGPIQAFYSNIEGAGNELWFGETNLDADPLFENSEDFTLNPASTCIDAGTNFLVVSGDTLIDLSEDEYEGFTRDIGVSETSQLFHPEANIVSIEDVPADQGGRVYLDFNRSFYDRDGLSRIESYQIDRFDNETWVGVATQNAYNDSTYRVEVTTLIDSSDVSDGMQQYRVIANMDEGNYLSGSAFGYSVDNIAPSVPQNLIGEPQENSMLLNWQPIIDEDLGYYLIYRNDASINGSSVPTFIDSELIYWNELVYTVAAVDINGNESELSNSINAVFSLLGDANLDSMVDVVDVVVTIDALFGYMDLTDQEIKAMDLDESGVINIIDIVMIIEIILNTD